MKVLVTGATGRVGANMVRRLLGSGAEVRAMVMPNDPQRKKLAEAPGLEIVEADLIDQGSVDKACRDVSHVVHLAAQLVRGGTPVDRFFDINALGTLRLLEGAQHAGGVERFVLASTDGTYRPGDPPAVPLFEDSPQLPADYYGTSKLLGEIILRNHAEQYDVPFAITRFATVISPEEAPRLFTLRQMRALLARGELGKDSNMWQLFHRRPNLRKILDDAAGDAADDTAIGFRGPGGDAWTLHLVDVRDAVEGVYLALTHPEALGRAFNVAASSPISYDDGAEIVSRALGVPRLSVEMPMTWRLEMSIDAARDSLGYVPCHQFEDMVRTGLDDGRGGPPDYIPAIAEQR